MAKMTKKGLFTNRHYRVRKKVSGTLDIPRMHVVRTNKHLYVQFIDDENGKTLVAVSTLSKEYTGPEGKNLKVAEGIGECAAKSAIAVGISKVVFDRGGRKFHGRLKMLADTARKAGLKF